MIMKPKPRFFLSFGVSAITLLLIILLINVVCHIFEIVFLMRTFRRIKQQAFLIFFFWEPKKVKKVKSIHFFLSYRYSIEEKTFYTGFFLTNFIITANFGALNIQIIKNLIYFLKDKKSKMLDETV